jgi:CO/xanthine dehydrogenase FAD-binding subunit
MPSLKYFRPKTLDEALTLLEQGVPLAGGTALTPRRYRLDAVIDLQDLGMAALERQGDFLEAGAGCTLQQLVEADALVSPALADACRQEAAWHLRNGDSGRNCRRRDGPLACRCGAPGAGRRGARPAHR